MNKAGKTATNSLITKSSRDAVQVKGTAFSNNSSALKVLNFYLILLKITRSK